MRKFSGRQGNRIKGVFTLRAQYEEPLTTRPYKSKVLIILFNLR
jgi:cytochrome oxidase Cu insertion factor (SCO1/SenC/PrrC family)